MISRAKQHAVIGVVAAVWLVLALLSGQALSPTPLKLYSVAGTAVSLVLISYDRFLRRWAPVRRLTGVPLLAGTWRGTLESSYAPTPGAKLQPIAVAVLITQTASSLTITLFSHESSSASTQARLQKLADGRWSLDWVYENNPRPAVRDRSARHTGFVELSIGNRDMDSLTGDYFTDRLTRGELRLTQWSPQRYSEVDSAMNAPEFGPPRLFA